MVRSREMVRPNLFIIGAQKSGTTSLHSYLGSHSDVFMSPLKEPAFFVPEHQWHPKDPDWYLGLFADAGGARFVGESSTHYTMRPLHEGVAERIAAFAPDARLIYVMRDPIKRAISHYWHNTRTLYEHRPILTALAKNEAYRDFGDYDYQLRPYVEKFGLERIHVLAFERLVEDPRSTVNSALSWLGLPDLPPDMVFTRENAMPESMVGLRGRGLLQRLRHHRLWEVASPHVPSSLKNWGKRLAKGPVTPTDEFDDEVIATLRPWAQSCIERLSALLGREFPEWTTSLGTEDCGAS